MVDAYIAFSKENPVLGEELFRTLAKGAGFCLMVSKMCPFSMVSMAIASAGSGRLWLMTLRNCALLLARLRPCSISPLPELISNTGLYKKAAECLRQSRFDESITPLDSLATALLPFSLCAVLAIK